MNRYATPEDAARAGMGDRYARVLGVNVAPWRKRAVVLVETDEPPATERYEVFCARQGSKWVPCTGSDSPGQAWLDDVSVRTFWDDAPDGSVAWRVEWIRPSHRERLRRWLGRRTALDEGAFALTSGPVELEPVRVRLRQA